MAAKKRETEAKGEAPIQGRSRRTWLAVRREGGGPSGRIFIHDRDHSAFEADLA